MKEKSSLTQSKKKGGEQMKRIEIIRKWWGKKSYAEIGKLTNQSADAVRKMGRKDGLKAVRVNKQNASEEVLTEIQLHKKTQKVSDLESKLKKAYSVIDKLSGDLDFSKETSKVKKIKLGSTKGYSKGATAFIVASDWHIGEVVEKEDVNGLNEFNSEIAIKRASNFFNNSIKLVKGVQRDIEVEKIVLAVLGDMISGSIHQELIAKNEFGVSEQVEMVLGLLVSGIEKLRDELRIPIDVECSMGNHGRATEERMISTEKDDSYEYILYGHLIRYFEGDKFVRVHRAKGYHNIIDIHGFTVRLHHGHSLKFSGGIGGLFIPAYKAIGNWNVAGKVDLDVLGHFHSFRDGKIFIANGSLVGYNAYALNIRAMYEKPIQAFFLVDHARKEKTVTAPIFLE